VFLLFIKIENELFEAEDVFAGSFLLVVFCGSLKPPDRGRSFSV
jgi:hypothetical protein